MGRYPNLDNINVFAYENNLDYARFKPTARLKMCNVPWCGDYDNVVKFDSDEARDAYLDSLDGDCIDLDTMFNVKPDGGAKVPVPVTSAQLFNYLIVDLPTMTSDAEPLEHAKGPRVGRYLYFINDAVQLSPNTTRLSLSLDVWSTYINYMRFDYVMLERGHAPVAASDVDAYLANPIANSKYLLTPDADTGGSPYIEHSTAVKNYSGDNQRFCIVTNLDLIAGAFGSASAPKVPTVQDEMIDGVPSTRVYTVSLDKAVAFLAALRKNIPWAKRAIEGAFFAPDELLESRHSFTWNGINVTVVNSRQNISTLLKLRAEDFGYDEKISKFAKLYTYPYAAIRVSTERGDSSLIRIEDLNSDGLRIATSLNLIIPFIKMQARFINIAGASDNLVFRTTSGREFAYGGAWGDYIKSWDIPVLQVVQPAYVFHQYDTQYTRSQQVAAADAALTSALASNSAAYSNAANTAANITDVNRVNVNANASITANANGAALDGATAANNKLAADCRSDNATSIALTKSENDFIAITTANNNANAAARTIGAVVTGGILGGASAAGTAMVNGVSDMAVSFPAANAAAAVSQSSNERAAGIAQSNALEKTLHGAQYTAATYGIQSRTATNNTNIRNDASTYSANANANLVRSNASNTRGAADANARRARNVAVDATDALYRQLSTDTQLKFGTLSNAGDAGTAPRALFAQVVTQRECDIANAGAAFARYGYTLNSEWNMSDMQVMKHFTFWKCSEVWCSSERSVSEGAQTAIKDILIRGVTVWSDPDDIGRVSIYDNL